MESAPPSSSCNHGYRTCPALPAFTPETYSFTPTVLTLTNSQETTLSSNCPEVLQLSPWKQAAPFLGRPSSLLLSELHPQAAWTPQLLPCD